MKVVSHIHIKAKLEEKEALKTGARTDNMFLSAWLRVLGFKRVKQQKLEERKLWPKGSVTGVRDEKMPVRSRDSA